MLLHVRESSLRGWGPGVQGPALKPAKKATTGASQSISPQVSLTCIQLEAMEVIVFRGRVTTCWPAPLSRSVMTRVEEMGGGLWRKCHTTCALIKPVCITEVCRCSFSLVLHFPPAVYYLGLCVPWLDYS